MGEWPDHIIFSSMSFYYFQLHVVSCAHGVFANRTAARPAQISTRSVNLAESICLDVAKIDTHPRARTILYYS